MPGDASPRAAPATKRIELADILARHGAEFLSQQRLPPRHHKVMQRIVACRTAAMGGHVKWCDDAARTAAVAVDDAGRERLPTE